MSKKVLHSISYFGVCGNVVVNHHIYCWNIESPTRYVSTKENIAISRLELIQGSKSLWLSKYIIIKLEIFCWHWLQNNQQHKIASRITPSTTACPPITWKKRRKF